MEPFIADLIKNPKVPKPIRYGIVIIICAFIIFIGVVCALNSSIFWGKIFGVLLAVVFFCVGVYLCVKISESSSNPK